MTNYLQEKIQRVQNSCVRFSLGLRKYDHISKPRLDSKILKMSNRRLHHSLSLMYNISRKEVSSYLCDHVAYQNNVHNHNTRNKSKIRIPLARTEMRSNSFFISICRKFNHIVNIVNIADVSLHTFKNKVKEYLLDEEIRALTT